MIQDEPVRGRIPPPWYFGMNGIDRCKAYSRGLLPPNPVAKLISAKMTHVVPGAVNVTAPASEALISINGQLETTPIMVGAMEGVSETALREGQRLRPLRFTHNGLRTVRSGNGNLLARARIINSNDLFVLAEMHLEDQDGRHICQGQLHSAIEDVTPLPPAPPEILPPVDDPIYERADPIFRNYPEQISPRLFDKNSGLEIVQQCIARKIRFPALDFFGIEIEDTREGYVRTSMATSEWFCVFDRYVDATILTALTSVSKMLGVITMHQPGTVLIPLDQTIRYINRANVDGQKLIGESRVREVGQNFYLIECEVRDFNGVLVGSGSGSFTRIDASRRLSRQSSTAQRGLVTLLFTDIVQSTQHAEELGDARWRELLDSHRVAVRRDIERHYGKEVDNAGDGFFARFESPAQAIECAKSIRATARNLGIEVREGIHTGECEIDGNTLSGMSVHVAARVQGVAKPSQILVTSTVKDLALGSGATFEEVGEHELKGVPDKWLLFVITDN